MLISLHVNAISIAQSQKEVLKSTIKTFFSGMKNSDTALIKSTLYNEVRLLTVTESGKLKEEKISEILSLISSAPINSLDERIEFSTVEISGNLAIINTPYSFYYNGVISYKGLNSFQLIKLNNTWKIFAITDSKIKKPRN